MTPQMLRRHGIRTPTIHPSLMCPPVLSGSGSGIVMLCNEEWII